jgi:hypothetical protein
LLAVSAINLDSSLHCVRALRNTLLPTLGFIIFHHGSLSFHLELSLAQNKLTVPQKSSPARSSFSRLPTPALSLHIYLTKPSDPSAACDAKISPSTQMDVGSLLSQQSGPKMQVRSSDPAAAPSSYYNPAQNAPVTTTPDSPKRKRIVFELIVPETQESRARLPMVVMVNAHDTTESIIATVRTFFGVYDGPYTAWGFSFEDQHGNTLISRYENFENNMTVYVRVRPLSPEQRAPPIDSEAEAQAFLRGGGEIVGSNGSLMTPADVSEVFSGSSSPTHGRGRRSLSLQNGYYSLPQPHPGRFSSHYIDDATNGYSSGDGASSRRSKSEAVASAEISLENIVEGGRRNRAKFESSVSEPT